MVWNIFSSNLQSTLQGLSVCFKPTFWYVLKLESQKNRQQKYIYMTRIQNRKIEKILNVVWKLCVCGSMTENVVSHVHLVLVLFVDPLCQRSNPGAGKNCLFVLWKWKYWESVMKELNNNVSGAKVLLYLKTIVSAWSATKYMKYVLQECPVSTHNVFVT